MACIAGGIGDTITTRKASTKSLAEAAVLIFDTSGFYPMEPESIASAAIQKRLGAKVVKIVYKGKGWSETDEPPEGMLF